ncbi:MAG: hypothetical protein L6V84_00005, partial [Oscillospiraceae bacterium]
SNCRMGKYQFCVAPSYLINMHYFSDKRLTNPRIIVYNYARNLKNKHKNEVFIMKKQTDQKSFWHIPAVLTRPLSFRG